MKHEAWEWGVLAVAPRAFLAGLLCLLWGGQIGPLAQAPQNSPGRMRERTEVLRRQPSILLISIDTWRWDYIGVSGAGKVATPALDRLAKEGIYEPEAETPYPLTTPAHATILTGLLPLHHGILDVIGFRLNPKVPTLAEAFSARGYSTAAFVSSVTLDRRYGLNRGFGTYDQGKFHGTESVNPDLPERDGAETTAAALTFLRAQPRESPQFIWVHYYDLHWPYRPHPAFDALYPGSQYAAEVAFVDGEVAKLLAFLHADGGRDWRVLVVGDHGEGFYDHHEKLHGMALYRSTLHVPLILWPRADKPLACPKPWRLEDLDPTVREMCGLARVGNADGRSLFQNGGRGRILPSLTIQPTVQYGVNPCLGIRRDDLMYIRHGEEELYDLAKDPNESRNLLGDPAMRQDLNALRRACDTALPLEALQAASSSFTPSSASDLEGLRGLGYIGGFVPNLKGSQRADIRKVCDDTAAFDRAKEIYRQRREPAPMRRAFEVLLAQYPRAAFYHQEFGAFLLRQGDKEAAAREFEAALRLNPRDTMSLADLAGLELMQGAVQRAKVLYESVLALEPDDPVAHKNLGIIYAGYLNEPDKAVAHYERYLQLAPDSDAPIVREYIRTHAKTH